MMRRCDGSVLIQSLFMRDENSTKEDAGAGTRVYLCDAHDSKRRTVVTVNYSDCVDDSSSEDAATWQDALYSL
jgi:hypothetical protein